MTDALLNAYHAVEALSAQMLQAAERADWPAFDQVCTACTRQVQSLRLSSVNPAVAPPWGVAQAAQKQAILLRILRNDAQIRRLRAGAMPAPVGSMAPAAEFNAYSVQASGGLLH